MVTRGGDDEVMGVRSQEERNEVMGARSQEEGMMR